MKYENLLERFLGYVRVNTRSDETSTTTPTTPAQKEFALARGEEMKQY
ncbi:MAG: peptidase T, partial [Streptococcaceae bacterium]|nr:peptidase T [Streptococcaceae bacterium]